ncbi:glycoside hydrolase family protein [Siccibacter turicensis]|uniref:Lysozyme n=1 Tax=Siccibacter turicensis TaxID=357233 RepID=C7C507_9ENTR|nr:glycoside hydrolase family protein [Siccibacter turicensis]CAZ90474.1 hypothetical protein [Siccibacter turicensis LMG 23730]
METRYPIRKADGKDFAGPDEVLALLRNEKHGQWLAGNNGMWHGGIHISRNAAPQAVISAESPEGAIPIQCIAQGEIVAWRIQQEYHQQPYGEAVEGEEPVMLQNSSAFVLVRSVHKPDDNPATWLTFYTLYMHLAPLSCFPKMKMFQVTQQGNGLSMRRYSGSEEPGQLAPDSSGRLRAGDKVVVTEEITFMLRSKKRDLAGRTPPDVPSPFGLAQKVKDGVPQGEKFWTSALPQYVAPLGDKYAYLPDWMAKAVESGSLDAVVIPPEPVAIRAGEAIGFLARDDAPGKGSAVLSDWFMHIEVLSNDTNMPAFLNNPGHLTKGTMYLEVQGNQPLYYCEEKGDKKTFTVMDVTTSTDAGKLLRRDDASPFKDDAGITWYKLRPHTWMKQDAVKEIIQHDLKALRFTPLQQEPAKDFQQSLGEQWLGKAFSFIGGAIHPERALESQELSEYYSQIAKVLDANGDGKISSTELDLYRSAVLQGLRNRNEEVEMLLRRLIVKHESEWYGKSAHPRWQALLASLPKDGQDYVKKWIDNHEWMSQVPALAKDEALWHFHPVEFIDAVMQKRTKEIIFPFKVKPNNDIKGKWKSYYWGASLTDNNASQAIFGRNRSNGARKHAARDLYSEPNTEIVAISNGIVKSITHYYYSTWQITIQHTTGDGRHFYIRYGEVDPRSIKVSVGTSVSQGDVVAKTGLMINPATGHHPNIIPGETVYMLHFEYYPGQEKTPPPNNVQNPPFQRRQDLYDPLEILQEGYRNTFDNAKESVSDRIAIKDLMLSVEGKRFIKDWEDFKSEAYNDSEGFCTIGYGHLIAKQRCENIQLSDEFKDGITKAKADELFELRLPNYINELKKAISVDLYQHEFDALVSLLFNMGSMRKAPLMRDKLNAGDYEGASSEFLDITNGGSAGLIARRNKEHSLFLTGVYDSSH